MKIAVIVFSCLLILGLTCFIIYNVVQIVKTVKNRKQAKLSKPSDDEHVDNIN